MNQICIECNSENLQKKGIRLAGKTRNLAYKCNDCGEEFSVPYNNEPEEIIENDDLHYIRDDEYISSIICIIFLLVDYLISAFNNSL